MPVQMPNANVTDNPPKPQPKIPRKQKAGNPSESVETSRPRRAIEPPVKYGYEKNRGSDLYHATCKGCSNDQCRMTKDYEHLK